MKINSIFDLCADNVVMYPTIREKNFYRIHNEEFRLVEIISDKPKTWIISNHKYTVSVYVVAYKKEYSEYCILFDKFKQLIGLPSTGAAIVKIDGKGFLVHLKGEYDEIVMKDDNLGYLRQRFLCTPVSFFIKRREWDGTYNIYSVERSCGNDKVDGRKSRIKHNENIERCLNGHLGRSYNMRLKLEGLIESDYRIGEYGISDTCIVKFMQIARDNK